MIKCHTQMKTTEFAFNEDIFPIYSCVENGVELGDFDTRDASRVAQNPQVDF